MRARAVNYENAGRRSDGVAFWVELGGYIPGTEHKWKRRDQRKEVQREDERAIAGVCPISQLKYLGDRGFYQFRCRHLHAKGIADCNQQQGRVHVWHHLARKCEARKPSKHR